MNPVCTGNDYKAFQISFLIVGGLVLTTYAPLLYGYTKSTCKLKSIKPLLYSSALFIFFNILFVLSQLAMMIAGCNRDPLVSDFYDTFMMGSYVLQTYGIVLVAYFRLYHVFKSSMFALSKCTNIVYKILLIIIPLCLITSVIFDKTTLSALLMVLGLLLLIPTLISTMILFICKLKKVFQATDSDDELITTITKLTILNGVSTTITFMFPIIIIVVQLSTPDRTKYYVLESTIFMFIILMDAYTNLWCIFLSFSNFNNYYMKICGCLHIKCESLCGIINGVNERKLAMQTAASNSSVTIPKIHSKNSEMSTHLPSIETADHNSVSEATKKDATSTVSVNTEVTVDVTAEAEK